MSSSPGNMKLLILATAAVSLLSLASAQPHGHRHLHPRADLTDYVTVTAPEVVVWVNDQGNTVSIETRTEPTPLPTSSVSDTPAVPTPSTQSDPSASPSELPSSFFAAPTPSVTEMPTSPPSTLVPVATTISPVPASPPADKEVPTSTAAVSSSDVSSAGPEDVPQSAPSATATPPPEPSNTAAAQQNTGGGFGITWSPYNTDSSCKSQAEANSELGQMAAAGFTMVRVYGVDCNQVAMTIAAVSPHNMVIFAGLTVLDNLANNLASMIAQVGFNWHMIDTVSICNECINDGVAGVGDVIAALGTARATLPPAGFAGRIVTVDTFNQVLAHPELCQNSDYCAANCHAFFDDLMTAGGAGNYVASQYTAIAAANPGKGVVITESGWPWAGNSNGAAIPSVANQQAAIASLRTAFASNPGSLILFDSFDGGWKQPGPLGIEQFFGIYGH